MTTFKYKFNRFLDLYIFPFLVNGYKQEAYWERMREKYKHELENDK